MTQAIAAIDPDLVQLPAEGASLDVYRRFLTDLDGFAQNFDRKLGRTRWLQGAAFNAVRALYKTAKEFEVFWRSLKWKQTSVLYARKIAMVIPPEQSHKLTYYEMLKIAYPKTFGQVENMVDAEWNESGESDEQQIDDHSKQQSGKRPAVVHEKTKANASPMIAHTRVSSAQNPTTAVAPIADDIREALQEFIKEIKKFKAVKPSKPEADDLLGMIEETRSVLAGLQRRLESVRKGRAA